jgi:DNA modification methylase
MGVASWRIMGDTDDTDYPSPGAHAQCSSVTQLRDLIAELSRPGDTVLDPFVGWGSTLVACAAKRRRGIGLEIVASRAAEARDRLTGHHGQVVVCADARRPPLPDGSVDLVLTDLPYFGTTHFADQPIEAEAATMGTFFAIRTYDTYLRALNVALGSAARVLRPGGRAAVCVRNRRIAGQFVPLAWDVARMLGRHLSLGDERIHLHARPADGDDPMITNRAHEYVLLGSKGMTA